MHQIPVYLVLEDDVWLHRLKPGINNPSVDQKGRYSQHLTCGQGRSCGQNLSGVMAERHDDGSLAQESHVQ